MSQQSSLACQPSFRDGSERPRFEDACANSREHLRERFLTSLQSSGKLKYKRYLATPLRYAGGKSLAVGQIIELLPPGLKKLASPFVGGGSVEIACANELGIKVSAYDVFDVLCSYWQVQLGAPEKLHRRLSGFEPNRQTFKEVKARLKSHWDGIEKLGKLDLAACYYFNSNTSYGPHFLGWPSDVYLNEDRYAKTLEKVRRFRAPNLSVRCADFESVVETHRDEFLYCDPPYYLDDGKTFVGMYPHRNFPVHHKGFRHDRLRDLLLSHKGGFVLSYNDCDVIKDWYSDFDMVSPKWQYTFGQGDTRIGANRASLNGGSHIKQSHELLIRRHPGER